MPRKSWREKYETLREPKIVDDPRGRGKMLIPTPRQIDALIRRVPKGKLVTIEQLREKLARNFGVNLTCPLVTGIHLKIISELAEEERRKGKKRVSPYWRVIKSGGRLYEKFPGGEKRQAKLLRSEGHEIIYVRGKPRIKDFEEKLIEL